MGYYFDKAKSRKDLNETQQIRYEVLRALPHDKLHPVLAYRLEQVREYIGPITSGEIWAELGELAQDAFVVWILAGEDPTKAELAWQSPVDLATPKPPPTEEERRRANEWSENFIRQLEEERRREELRRQQAEADGDEYFRVHHRLRNFFRRIFRRAD